MRKQIDLLSKSNNRNRIIYKCIIIFFLQVLVFASCTQKPNRVGLAGNWEGKSFAPRSASSGKKYSFRDYGSSSLKFITDSTLDFSIYIEKEVLTNEDFGASYGIGYRLAEAGTRYSYVGRYKSDAEYIYLFGKKKDDTTKIAYRIIDNELILETTIDNNNISIIYQ